jgi:hypothetical protein
MYRNRELSDSKYGTHMAPLITAIMNTTGPVFEMGCGDYSTPLLHSICKVQNRFLLSTDTSAEWIKKFLDMKSDIHDFQHVKVYDDDWQLNPKPSEWDNIGNQEWGVVFVDHRPGERRKVDIKRFENTADIIVFHDSETSSYEYSSVMYNFKYRYTYDRYSTWTTLVSNTLDVKKLFV